MSEDKHNESVESLGEYLQRQRREKNYSREEFARETRIPPGALMAMEDDDYGSLPAETFTRGFYTLYAKHLKLDPADVLARLDKERTVPAAEQLFIPPSKLEKQANPMASGGPPRGTGPTVVLGLLLLIGISTYLFYSFTLNPTALTNDQLDDLQQQAPVVNQTRANEAAESQPKNEAEPMFPSARYFLTIDFLKEATITVAIDDGLPVEEEYEEGATQSWYADEEIVLLLPADAEMELFFDGHRLDLPAPHNGTIRLNLP